MQQIPFSLPHKSAMGAEDFLVTPCNREGFAWIEKWPDWPVFGLVLVGQPGSGKTHLLSLWREKSNARNITFNELLAQDAATLAAGTKAIAIDDADKIGGHAEAEERFFHLYNHLKSNQSWLLLTLKQGAGQTGFLLPDLRSRLLALPAATLQQPDDQLIEALIIKQFRDRQIVLDAGVVNYLAPRVRRDAASIRAMVDRLDQASLAAGRKISITLARQMIGESDV